MIDWSMNQLISAEQFIGKYARSLLNELQKQAAKVILLTLALLLMPIGHASADALSYADLWPRIDGSAATQPLTNAIYQHWTGMQFPQDDLAIRHHWTRFAYQRLLGKTGYNQYWDNSWDDYSSYIDWDDAWGETPSVDLIFVAEPAADKLEALRLDYEVIPVVRDALVFLNNQQNPVTGLTTEQLLEIYTGEIDDWSALGGISRSIDAYQRPTDTDCKILFKIC